MNHLIANWVNISRMMVSDQQFLSHSLIVKLEDFANQTGRELSRIWTFLGLTPGKGAADFAYVEKDPNAKYRKKYCDMLVHPDHGQQALAAHKAWQASYENAVQAMGFGYSLNDWDCVATAKLEV